MNQGARGASARAVSTLVTELVGPAGAGKSTISRALTECSKEIRIVHPPGGRSLQTLGFYLMNSLRLMPLLIRVKLTGDRKLTRGEIASMAVLDGWPRLIRQRSQADCRVILLDPGPLLMMAELILRGPRALRQPFMQRWWRKICNQWAEELDKLVILDANDTILTNRIRTRDKQHVMKEALGKDVHEFLCAYRLEYDRLVHSLVARGGGPDILRFDTSNAAVLEIARQIQSLLNCR